MTYVTELDTLFIHLKETLKLPNDLSDLLRAEWVYAVSALDKLIHELIRIGMLEAFQGTRPRTAKFLAFNVSLSTHTLITSSTPISIPPPEYFFEQEVMQKHKTLSFQDPDKIADGLSLIWGEQHKWQTIAISMGIDKSDLTTRLRNIISRRNQIVHEADLDLLTGLRNSISKVDIDFVVGFINTLSEQIFNAVK
ncbi:HEPN domain-containing protein [Flavobacterium sp. FlaQc-51]|uniref:HEPN domain-containing protein n=1 Tax=unclassified Flavobacterium TaxID=196869 RepID=UPI000B1425B5|nr:HEPN domain-containing protein [Flavobacterium sp. Leaf82]